VDVGNLLARAGRQQAQLVVVIVVVLDGQRAPLPLLQVAVGAVKVGVSFLVPISSADFVKRTHAMRRARRRR